MIIPALIFGEKTVPPGADITIDEGNLSEYSSGIVFADDSGVVRLNLSSAPVMQIVGAGTVVKTSDADWTMTTPIPDFTGDYILAGSGVVSSGIAEAFGYRGDNTYAHSLTVSNGCTLSVTANEKYLLGYRVLELNGSGARGRGSLEVKENISSNEAIFHIRLGSDAEISFPDGKYLFLAATGRGLNLNGNRLAVTGKGTIYQFGKLAGEGELVLRGNAGGYVNFIPRDNYFIADASETSPIVLNNHARLNFYNAAKRIERPLWVSGEDNVVYHSEQWPDRNPDYDWRTNIVAVGGPVTFTNETGLSHLKVYNSFPRRLLTLAGSITGHGAVSVVDNIGGVRFEGTESTFDGGLYVSGKNGGQFQAMCPGSVGAYASVTGDYGHIDADFSVEAGDGRWSWAEFADFAKKATWLNGAFPLLDARSAAEPLEVSANDIAGVSSLGVAGETVMSDPDNLMEGFAWRAGVLKFAAADTVDWSGGISIASSYLCTNPVPGIIVLDGGVSVQTGETPVQIGGDRQNPAEAAARLVVKMAMLTNKNPAKHESVSAAESALVVGGCDSGGGTGILELHDGAIVTNKLLVGGKNGTIDQTKGSGNGGVWQFGGSMAALGTSASHYLGGHLGLDFSSHGGYEMHGGNFVALGTFQIGYYGTGVWSQYAGHAVFTNAVGDTADRSHDIGGGNHAHGCLYLAGGRIDSYGSIAINSSGHPTVEGFGHLAVDGAGACYDAHEANVAMNQAADGKGNAFVEMNHGGVFRALSLCVKNATARGGYVGFDGGTFKLASGANPKDFFYGENYRPTRITVYPGGAKFDTAGFAGVSVRADLEGTVGGGVVSAPMDAPLKHSSMVASPIVLIEGDGRGASAVAQFDPYSGCVTNVLITAAGVDYSTATAKLMIANDVIASIPCVVAAVPNTGSLTKTGGGDLTLYGTNTYGGATVLAGGVLRLGSDGALPHGTRIELAGGVIDVNGFGDTLPRIWEVDALKAYGQGCIAYDGNLAFPQGAKLRIKNLGRLPDDCARLKILAVKGEVSAYPELEDVDCTSKSIRFSNGILRMNSSRGLTILLR